MSRVRGACVIEEAGDEAVVALGEDRALVFDDMLGAERAAAMYTAALVRFVDGSLRRAGIGPGAKLVPTVRGDFIAWIGAEDPSFAPVLELFAAVRDSLNAAAWLGARSLEVQLAVYPLGAAYARHRDQARGLSRDQARGVGGPGERRMTLVYYLSPWRPGDGGELELWEPDGVRVIEPRPDRLVVFRPHVDHAVLPVTRDYRVALSGWLRTSPV